MLVHTALQRIFHNALGTVHQALVLAHIHEAPAYQIRPGQHLAGLAVHGSHDDDKAILREVLAVPQHHIAHIAHAGAVMVDGLGVGDVGNVVLRDRKHLSEDGLVIIVATVDSKTGKVLAGPDLVSRGFVYVRENESLMDGAQSIVENALERCVDEHVRDWNSVKTRVREALSSYIYRRTKRSPMIPADPDGGLTRAHRKAVQRLRRQKTNET